MGFYEDKLVPIIKEVSSIIEKTPHMQDILNGTMPIEKFKFQIEQNYLYLLDYTKSWAIGLSKCNNFNEMKKWYGILKNTMEGTVIMNRDFWAKEIDITLNELDNGIQAPGKRSYTAFQLMCAEQGGLAECFMALFPCNILYRFFAEDLLPICSLPKDNKYYQWLEFYISEEYIMKTEIEIKMVNELCENKTKKELEKLLEIFVISCNYEILQWKNMYYNMETWPLDDIFLKKLIEVDNVK